MIIVFFLEKVHIVQIKNYEYQEPNRLFLLFFQKLVSFFKHLESEISTNCFFLRSFVSALFLWGSNSQLKSQIMLKLMKTIKQIQKHDKIF